MRLTGQRRRRRRRRALLPRRVQRQLLRGIAAQAEIENKT